MVEVLQRAAAAGPEMPAARIHALRRGLQHLDRDGIVMAALAARAAQQHALPGQRAVHEHRLAVDMGDPPAFLVQRFDHRGLRRGERPQAAVQAAPYWRQCVSFRLSSQSRTRAISSSCSPADSWPRASSKRSHTR